ncbi:MAG: hypothetical protein M0Z70_05170 [Nitrospiraceae bacterium]|nr:hypothetical protein [Nitrospiraceae bacterium]
MDFANLYSDLLSRTSYLMSSYSNEIGSTAIALAFVMSLFRIGNEAWKGGYDKSMPFIKDQATKFLVVVALCMPFNLIPGYNGSFITTFPQVVMNAGFETAKGMVSAGGNWSASTLIMLPAGLDDKIRKLKQEQNATAAEKEKEFNALWDGDEFKKDMSKNATWGSIGTFLKGLAVAGLILLIMSPLLIGLAMVGGIAGWIAAGTIVVIVLAQMQGWASGTVSVTPPAFELLRWALNEMAQIMFTSVSTFSFYAVMITAAVKAVIHTLLFPISVVNVGFESRRQIFYGQVAKFVSLALTPVVACIVFIVSAEAFAMLSGKFGLIEVMQRVFVGSTPAQDAPIMSIVSWFFRFAVACLVAPAMLALPVAKLIWQSERFAAEAVGQGFAAVNMMQNWGNVGANMPSMPRK